MSGVLGGGGMAPDPITGATIGRGRNPLAGLLGGGGRAAQNQVPAPPAAPEVQAYQPNYELFWNPAQMVQQGNPYFGAPWYMSAPEASDVTASTYDIGLPIFGGFQQFNPWMGMLGQGMPRGML